MNEAERSIFRVSAVRRYTQAREQAVLPRFVSPPTRACLWILLGLLVVSGFIAGSARVPVYASGPAVILHSRSGTQPARDEIVAFLPPEHLSRLRVGQRMLLRRGFAGERGSFPVVAVDPEVCSPDAAEKRFALSAAAARAITGPAAVAIARWEPSLRVDPRSRVDPRPAALPASAYAGSIGHVDVEVGSRRVISLLIDR